MAFNENLAKMIHSSLIDLNADFVERKMFGGIAFMIQEKMACGIVKDELMVRVIPERFEEALNNPFARQMDFTGKPMKGFLFVSEEGFETEEALKEWLRLGIEFAQKGAVKSRKK